MSITRKIFKENISKSIINLSNEIARGLSEYDIEYEKQKTIIQELTERLAISEHERSSQNKDRSDDRQNEIVLLGQAEKGKLLVGIPNLEKRKEEAIFDAMRFFDKKCPYCGVSLYEGHVRNHIEIDHFFPISKGGQDFPWNILPICQNCNRKKKNTMPYVFLQEDIYTKCYNYLISQKEKITGLIEDTIIDVGSIENILMSNKSQTNNNQDILSEILSAINPRLIDFIPKQEASIDTAANEKKKYGISDFSKVLLLIPKEQHSKIYEYNMQRDELRFCLKNLYEELKDNSTDRSEFIDIETMNNVLKSIPGYYDRKSERIAGKVKICHLFRYGKMPEELKCIIVKK